MNAASNVAVAAAQQLIIPAPLTNSSSNHIIKVADPEKFSGDRAENEGFIQAIKLVITVQPGSFLDEKTKLLHILSFMSGGSAQIWAKNEMDTVIKEIPSMKNIEDFIVLNHASNKSIPTSQKQTSWG